VLRAFDIISMPPASLVANARCVGEHYEIERGWAAGRAALYVSVSIEPLKC